MCVVTFKFGHVVMFSRYACIMGLLTSKVEELPDVPQCYWLVMLRFSHVAFSHVAFSHAAASLLTMSRMHVCVNHALLC